MKSVFKVLAAMRSIAIIALVAVIGFGFVSCSGDDDGGGGTTAVTGVTLNKTTLSLTVGGSEKLIATVAPSNATNKAVTWSSYDTSKATVSTDGTVTAIAAGTTTIYAVAGDYSDSCAVTVTPPPVSIPTTGVTTLTKEEETSGLSFASVGSDLWFKFVATANPQIFYMQVGPSTSAEIYVKFQLYDASGVAVGDEGRFWNKVGGGDEISRTVTVGSTYYIKLTLQTGSTVCYFSFWDE